MGRGKERCAECPIPRVLPDGQVGVAAYWAVSTQWRTGFSGRTGLDYTACLATLALHLPRWLREAPTLLADVGMDEVLADLQVIEAAILQADGERREAEEAQNKQT